MQREKKTEIITLRVTSKTKDRIRAKAQELGLTVTDYLCLCGLGKKIVRVDGLDQVLSELKAQGRNLNLSPPWPTWARSPSCTVTDWRRATVRSANSSGSSCGR